jgi:DNA-directed RNA polymerase subunit RPC12/RpoP
MIECSCKASHAPGSLPLIGWQDFGDGTVGALANCPKCGSTIVVQILDDTSLCTSCRKPISGANGDTKIVVEYPDGDSHVYCKTCSAGLVGVGEQTENARAMRSAAACGGLKPRRYTMGDLQAVRQ